MTGKIASGGLSAERLALLRRKYPTIADLRARAKRRVPGFGFAYVDGGVGEGDLGTIRNAAAFAGVEVVPRYGVDPMKASSEVELFGQRYAAPIGISPMGFPGILWPNAEEHMARAAQRARIPILFGVVGGRTIERIAELAPDVFWLQLYRFGLNDHKIGFDLVRRAQAAGARVLTLTLDVPTRAKRPRELREGLVYPFRPDMRAVYEVATSPAWLLALMRHGAPRFANLAPYVEKGLSDTETGKFVRREMGGGFNWEEVARYRDAWKGPLMVKGILHPADAEKAVSLGIEGILVSNHGGRQFESAPATIDVLPAIVQQVGNRATVILDSGVRSGVDVVRVAALGGRAAFAGRPYLFAVAALGEEGADYVIDLLVEETKDALRQAGVPTVAAATSLVTRHPGAMWF